MAHTEFTESNRFTVLLRGECHPTFCIVIWSTLIIKPLLFCLALPCLNLPCLGLPCLALPCLALPCLALPCLALPCLALPCLVLAYLALSCHAMPCLALFFWLLLCIFFRKTLLYSKCVSWFNLYSLILHLHLILLHLHLILLLLLLLLLLFFFFFSTTSSTLTFSFFLRSLTFVPYSFFPLLTFLLHFILSFGLISLLSFSSLHYSRPTILGLLVSQLLPVFFALPSIENLSLPCPRNVESKIPKG